MTERIGLVGCVKTKLAHPAPARDLYTSPLFRGRRNYVERSCGRWFILSAEHGLVDPGDVLEPYDLALNDVTPAERRAWSEGVLGALEERLGSLDGLRFEAHAGSTYLDNGLVVGLLDAGAGVERPAEGLGLFDQLSFYASGDRRADSGGTAKGGGGRGGKKYEPLAEHLLRQGGASTEMTFDEVAHLVEGLPASARKHQAWWANDETHPQARAWLGAGWRARINPATSRVRFDRS